MERMRGGGMNEKRGRSRLEGEGVNERRRSD
jgi:hypothetical protein